MEKHFGFAIASLPLLTMVSQNVVQTKYKPKQEYVSKDR